MSNEKTSGKTPEIAAPAGYEIVSVDRMEGHDLVVVSVRAQVPEFVVPRLDALDLKPVAPEYAGNREQRRAQAKAARRKK